MENTLFYGDNLTILREHIDGGSIDLIYLDPPFNSKATYNILYKEPNGLASSAQVTAFEDSWHWTEETANSFEEIIDDKLVSTDIKDMMLAFRKFIGLNDMMAYLSMMCIRLIGLQRVLKNTGSIYLHCDPTASHYLKIVMDTIFGKRNFRNEIAWCYTGASSPGQKQFPRKHDIIFWYSNNTDKWIFNHDDIRIPYSESTLNRIKAGELGGKSAESVFHGKRTKRTMHKQGKIPEDWWLIPVLGSTAKERLGYPTQKPERLLERIIKASTSEGDMVLDPFCGCGTTIMVAQGLRRKWIGIDITHLATTLIKKRLYDMWGLEAKKDYDVVGEPTDLASAKELASQNRYQFEWWGLSLIGAQPYKGKIKGSDKGIDGVIYFKNVGGEIKKAMVQVKSGNVGVDKVRDLCHVVNREKAVMGFFITLHQPTKDMIKEALGEGFYKHKGSSFQKIQILTIESLLSGTMPSAPFYYSGLRQSGKHIPDQLTI